MNTARYSNTATFHRKNPLPSTAATFSVARRPAASDVCELVLLAAARVVVVSIGIDIVIDMEPDMGVDMDIVMLSSVPISVVPTVAEEAGFATKTPP
jgi:hypothetical protein